MRATGIVRFIQHGVLGEGGGGESDGQALYGKPYSVPEYGAFLVTLYACVWYLQPDTASRFFFQNTAW